MLGTIKVGFSSGLHSSLVDIMKDTLGGRKRKKSEDKIEERQKDMVIVNVPNNCLHDDDPM